MKSTERQKTMQLWLLHLISMHYTCSATVPGSDLQWMCTTGLELVCPPGCYYLWTGAAAASWSITLLSPRSHFIDKPLKRLHAQRSEHINAALMFSICPAAVYDPHGLVELPSAPLEHLALWSWRQQAEHQHLTQSDVHRKHSCSLWPLIITDEKCLFNLLDF